MVSLPLASRMWRPQLFHHPQYQQVRENERGKKMSCCVYLCKAVFNSDKTVTGFQEEIPQCNMDVTEAIKRKSQI